MFTTINFSRVGVALVLNFFDMMKIDSIYSSVMGTTNMGLLGDWVIKGMPGVLFLIFLAHYFDIWGRIIRGLKLPDKFVFSGHIIAGSYSTEIVRQFRN